MRSRVQAEMVRERVLQVGLQGGEGAVGGGGKRGEEGEGAGGGGY